MELTEIKYLGIDIGGAHLKYIGINKKKEIKLVNYIPYKIWSSSSQLEKNLKNLSNKIKSNKTICGITMSAELCDIFPNRENGVKELIRLCKILKFNKLYYTFKKSIFSEDPKANEIMSMNWHSIGRLCEKRIKDCVIIDFGSTTTDFICIKNFKFINKYFTDFSRLNNHELIYTGVSRTPIFSILKNIIINKKNYNLIPEYFSDMSDVYRIMKMLNWNIDLDDTRDGRGKSQIASKIRVSRNFGFDYDKSKNNIIEKICNKLSDSQLTEIKNNLSTLKFKYQLPNNTKIVLSGIGQDVLHEFLTKKNIKVLKLHEILKIKNKNNATNHAPALSIALLLSEVT